MSAEHKLSRPQGDPATWTKGQLLGEVYVLAAELESAKRDAAAKQARIDELMWEYEPARMTPEQIEEWGRHQVRCSPEEEVAINAAIAKEQP